MISDSISLSDIHSSHGIPQFPYQRFVAWIGYLVIPFPEYLSFFLFLKSFNVSVILKYLETQIVIFLNYAHHAEPLM